MLCPKRGTSDQVISKDGHVGLIANFSACCSSPLVSEDEHHHGSICSSCPHWLLKAIGSTSPVVLWFSYTSPVVLPSEYENDQCAQRRISNPIKAGIQRINPPHPSRQHSFITTRTWTISWRRNHFFKLAHVRLRFFLHKTTETSSCP